MSLKQHTAKALKWNLVDKVATQLLYAVTGIVLARELSQEDFGLVGAALVFQAFASLFVDSGFSSALIQRKHPSRLDYSTVFWFNLAVAILAYLILFFAAPLIADCFQGDRRIIGLSRLMFLTFILNAVTIVQTNRLMKHMNVRPIALTNSASLIVGGLLGIVTALNGCGAYSIVWQNIAGATVRASMLWAIVSWRPSLSFSFDRLKSYFKVGSGVMATSFLNTLFLNVYAFFIGNRVSLTALGYYTQADKWSKMGIMSLSQTLTSAFLPTLSALQDDIQRFEGAVRKMNRLTAYLTFPAMLILALIAAPLFRTLFSDKWDAAVPLFQLLLVRGIFLIFSALVSNYVLSLGHSRMVLKLEAVRDSLSLIALFALFPMMTLSTANSPIEGVTILLAGQLGATFIAWLISLIATARQVRVSIAQTLRDLSPAFAITVISCAVTYIVIPSDTMTPLIETAVKGISASAIYLALSHLLGSKIQKDALNFIRNKKI